ncbi:MAG: Ig-like domain-containing protein [Alphaproteobacteria bacterium]
MNKLDKPVLLALLGAFVLAIALGLNWFIDWRGDDSPAPAPVARSGEGPLQAPPLARQPAAPSFDVVRVNPSGDTVIAGRAEPGAEVTVMDGESVVGKVQADKRGEWVLVPEKPLPPGSRNLSLIAKLPDGTELRSQSDVVLVVPENGEAQGVLALRVPSEGQGASRLLQSPFAGSDASRGDGRGARGLTIDIIDYDEKGRATVSGSAPAGARLNIYLDDALAGSTAADAKNEWRLALPQALAPGDHKLRVDQLDGAGKVTDRAEYAFNRAPPTEGLTAGTAVIVQPGNSLWRLARRTYGEGTRYALIFEANKSQIRDPDLIYPGQVFALPAAN